MKRAADIRKEHKKWNQFLLEKIEFLTKTSEKTYKGTLFPGIAAMGTQGPLAHEVLLYQIFKDSDELNRFRLWSDGPDAAFLRTEAAQRNGDKAFSSGHIRNIYQRRNQP